MQVTNNQNIYKFTAYRKESTVKKTLNIAGRFKAIYGITHHET
jgi:hypothetical protein